MKRTNPVDRELALLDIGTIYEIGCGSNVIVKRKVADKYQHCHMSRNLVPVLGVRKKILDRCLGKKEDDTTKRSKAEEAETKDAASAYFYSAQVMSHVENNEPKAVTEGVIRARGAAAALRPKWFQ